MAEFEEKFIVINKKRFEELKKESGGFHVVFELIEAIGEFDKKCRDNGIKIDQKYIVCNQDEPYAGNVLKIILEGEEKKVL